MPTFSSFLHFGDNFGNEDVVRILSFFLNQRDKIALSQSTRGVHRTLLKFLSTSKKYVTTVRPNLLSAFSVNKNGTYHSKPGTFRVSRYGNFGNFYQSMITHVGANEDRDYYAAWVEHHFGLGRGAARNHRGVLDLYIRQLPLKHEKLLVERLRESKDTELWDHNNLGYTRDIEHALEGNTSIVHVTAYSEFASCRCNLFHALSMRSTDLTKLTIIGGICPDTAQGIADSCVQELTNLSLTSSASAENLNGLAIDVVCEAVASVGILKNLEIGNVVGQYDDWADGLILALETCPISSLRINETDFMQSCVPGLVGVLPLLEAGDVKLTNCNFADFGEPVLSALFSNESICYLDLSYTKIEEGSIGPLVEMIKHGTLLRLAIGWCSVGKDDVKNVLGATTCERSDLEFLSICGNDLDSPETFQDLLHTSLTYLHVGGLSPDLLCAVLAFTGNRRNNGDECEIDTRDCEECYDDCCGGVWPR
ncbi:unnamed protein product [Ectocarpus sp. 12 AP-2014]